ncbi:hypothetical protein [Rhodococcus erythropolis]|uniref:hypothetical protein n=1 Tax=Rhodococcus erythropolis TaxID=1833 RepID=UPI00038E5A4A|nr:hypothetical protein [Rhodococcus erythropolis]EQM32814.1 hypothetical protein N601_14880 [Rhodococcus erythropolis DN1]
MITPHDELLIHQLPTTLDHVSQSDLRWTERIVMYGFDKTGEISIMTGLAKYPNRNVLDAYAMVTRKGEEARVVRLSTELNPQSGGLAAWSVGPYTYEIVEPLRQVRSTVDANEHGLSLQLDFHGDFPVYEQTAAFHRTRGRVREDARRFYQNGTITGWIGIDGTRIDIDPDNWWFGRDHSWGVRHGGGGGSPSEGANLQPSEVPDGVLYYMGIFQFDDEVVHFAQRETSTGARWQFEGEVLFPIGSGKGALPIIDVEHDLKFRDDMRVVESGTFTVHRADRTTDVIEVNPVCDFWPGLAGYDEYRGYASGMYRGKDFSDSFTVDITNLDEIRQVSMLSETLCEVRMGDKVGYGLVEMVFMGVNPRYGYTDWSNTRTGTNND